MKKIYFAMLTVSPYLVAGTLILLFANNELTEMIIQDNFFRVAIPVAQFITITFWSTFICVYKSLKNKWDAYSFLKTITVIKLIHIPAYIAIFVIGAICMITVFTRAFTILLAAFDWILLLMSGLITCAAMLRMREKYPTVLKKYFWVFPLQFVFCADVFATIFIFKKLKAEQSDNNKNPD